MDNPHQNSAAGRERPASSFTDPSFAAPSFTVVPVRERQTGWTPARQAAFIEALAETACVTEAAARVGLSSSSAYQLRRRLDAEGFRAAWDAALDYAVHRLSDAVLGRALNGVATPVFYQGALIGERRRYDERLAMFLLRCRQPGAYGAWHERMNAQRSNPDAPAIRLAKSLDRIAQEVETIEAIVEDTDQSYDDDDWVRWRDALREEAAALRARSSSRPDSGPDVA